jgi:ABC-2 type transport system permease protein
MALYDVGYRPWSGIRTGFAWRWLTIASSGVGLIWRGTWIRRTVPLTWLPVLFAGLGFFTYEQSLVQPRARWELSRFIAGSLNQPDLAEAVENDPASVRHEVWSTILMTFFRYPQAIALVLLVGLIAPRLISYDLRSRAYLLYFSRPLSILEYVLGKLSIVWFYLFLITTLPALCLYGLGVLLSPEWGVVLNTWDLPLRILAASLVLLLPTASLALAFSSLTTESRYASLAWLATWIMGAVAYSVLTISGNERWESNFTETSQWRWLSLYHVSGEVQQWIFGLSASSEFPILEIVLLGGLTLISLVTIYYRLAKTLRA